MYSTCALRESPPMLGMMLICIGTLVAASGAVAVQLRRKRACAALRVVRTKPTRLPDVRLHSLERIDGIVRTDATPLVAPCSGRPAGWFRVRLHKMLGPVGGETGGGVWGVVFSGASDAFFHVEDSSGARALVRDDAPEVFTTSRTFKTLPPDALGRVVSFMETRGSAFTGADLFEEESITAGDSVSVVGEARSAETVEPGPYREALGAEAYFRERGMSASCNDRDPRRAPSCISRALPPWPSRPCCGGTGDSLRDRGRCTGAQ